LPSARNTKLGFTLIELMVTLAVVIVLLLLALPSFRTFQQRSALRGAAEQSVQFWNQMRLESAKRNQMVKFGIVQSGSNFCLGAAQLTATEITTVNGGTALTVPCDCFTAGACDVAVFPADQSEWKGATYRVVSGTPTLGAGNAVVVIEPKRTSLMPSSPSQAGVISFDGPARGKAYRLNMRIDEFGRALLCESASATDKMSDYASRRCSP
jgi:prepilin-type N-terminal cleavage/methylation domain-containing protein